MDRTVGLAYGGADSKDAGYAKRISYLLDGEGRIQLAYPEVKPDEHLDQILRDLGS